MAYKNPRIIEPELYTFVKLNSDKLELVCNKNGTIRGINIDTKDIELLKAMFDENQTARSIVFDEGSNSYTLPMRNLSEVRLFLRSSVDVKPSKK